MKQYGKTKYLILGAGPAGLTLANRLRQLGEESFIILEKEKESGGLCRSEIVDNSPLDIGGGHFLDVRNPVVNKFLFQFMPEEEWDKYERNSKIYIQSKYINSPIEANIWQMDINEQILYLKDIALSGCNLGTPMPEKFIDWIYWKLGKKISDEYMIPYNIKMYGDDLEELGTYWLNKLPSVSFEETLKSCLERKAYGAQPGHAQFYYPKKYGYGELWRRMAENIKENIIYGEVVNTIDFDNKIIESTSGEKYTGEKIITTIPWKEFQELNGMPEKLKKEIGKLKHTAIETRYFSRNLDTDAHWVYYPDTMLPYHRILVRHNFCRGSLGYWTETRKERVSVFGNLDNSSYTYINPYAYPVNTIEKPMIMSKLLAWVKERGVYGLGRWGEHQHYNSDVTVEKALLLAEKLIITL